VARASDVARINDERVAIVAIHRTGKDIPTRSINVTMWVVLDNVGQVLGSPDEDTRSGLTYSSWVHAARSRRADSRHRQRLWASRSTLERKAELDYGYLEDRTWGATLSGAPRVGGVLDLPARTRGVRRDGSYPGKYTREHRGARNPAYLKLQTHCATDPSGWIINTVAAFVITRRYPNIARPRSR
jgi:hypothetical protein